MVCTWFALGLHLVCAQWALDLFGRVCYRTFGLLATVFDGMICRCGLFPAGGCFVRLLRYRTFGLWVVPSSACFGVTDSFFLGECLVRPFGVTLLLASGHVLCWHVLSLSTLSFWAGVLLDILRYRTFAFWVFAGTVCHYRLFFLSGRVFC